MNPSWRKPFGILVMLTLITIWALAAAFSVDHFPILNNPIFYIVAGIAWIWLFPMKSLMRWMETGKWRD